MYKHILALVLSVGIVLAAAGTSSAQTQDGWKTTVYPILAWVPLGIAIDVNVPSLPGSGGGPDVGGGGGEIIDGRFDGAFLGGVSTSNGTWRIDADGMWAAVGGDRPDRPKLKVDVDVIYFHATGGFAIAKDLFITGGVRRFALDYDVKLGDLPNFSRKPGVWDPLVGLGWHRVGEKIETHAVFEGGGFGVGADVDLGGSFRVDWKPAKHFGLTAGYNFLYFKVENTLVNRTFTVKQTLHGPILGIGIYF